MVGPPSDSISSDRVAAFFTTMGGAFMKNVKWLVLVLCFAFLTFYACQSLKRAKAPAKAGATKAPAVSGTKCDGKNGEKLIEAVFPDEASWTKVFVVANTDASCNGKNVLSREHLISAVKDNRYGDFLGSSSTVTNIQELAAFLANASHETTGAAEGKFDGGLCFAVERGCPGAAKCSNYCRSPDAWGPKCPDGYYGRGALQISWPMNYAEVSKDIFGDADILLNDPNKLLGDDTAWKASLVFWLKHIGGFGDTSQTTIKDQATCHNAITSNTVDFGKTIEIINGDIECNSLDVPEAINRIDYYKTYVKAFSSACGVSIEPTTNLKCVLKATKSSRCGKDWTDANGRCGQICRTADDCPKGEACFGRLDTKVCQ